MNHFPEITGIGEIASPALLFDVDRIGRNLDRMLEMAAGEASRLRPHLKTHKCAEILALQIDRGITSAKCSTIAEAELAARAGCDDVLVAYPLVGPNARRFRRLAEIFPETRFSTLVDSLAGAKDLSSGGGAPARVFLDLDCGMHRTGILPGDEALALVQWICEDSGLEFAGVHAYDGHIHDPDRDERERAFSVAIDHVDRFLSDLETAGIEVPLVVSGGSPTFPLHAAKAASSDIPWHCSPGTTLLWDAGYGHHYPDLAFESAAFLLARVVSHPGDNLVCIDLGHKAVSAENPLDRRVRFPAVEGAVFRSQSEEHLVVEVPDPSLHPIGSEWLGLPWHVCPTVALYQRAVVVENGNATDATWEIAARDRRLSV